MNECYYFISGLRFLNQNQESDSMGLHVTCMYDYINYVLHVIRLEKKNQNSRLVKYI